MNESILSEALDSLDTRGFRRGALATLRSSKALDRTVKSCYLTISQNQYQSPKSKRRYKLSPNSHVPSAQSSTLFDDLTELNLSEHTPTLAELTTLPKVCPEFPATNVFSRDVSSSMVKDAMINRMREYDAIKRQSSKGDSVFTDSVTLLSGSGKKDHGSTYTALTHHSKLSSLVNSKEEYSYKWQKMREHRTQQRMERDELKKQRNTATLFHGIVKHMEREVYDEKLHTVKRDISESTLQVASKNKTRQRTAHQLFTLQQDKEYKKKKQEINELKAVTQSNIQLIRSQIEEEKAIIRLQRPLIYGSRESLFSARSDASTMSSTSTSFIIKIPEELLKRVQLAKSLQQYTAAKKDVRDYQERMYSEKLRSVAIQKHLAQQKAKRASSPLHVSQMDGSDYFSDDSPLITKYVQTKSMITFDDTINSDLDDLSIK